MASCSAQTERRPPRLEIAHQEVEYVLVHVNPNYTHGRNLFERNGLRMIIAARRDGETDAVFRPKGRPVG
jgi:hypothetical protein